MDILGRDGQPARQPSRACGSHIMMPVQFIEYEDLLTGATSWVVRRLFCFTCGARGLVDEDLIRRLESEDRENLKL